MTKTMIETMSALTYGPAMRVAPCWRYLQAFLMNIRPRLHYLNPSMMGVSGDSQESQRQTSEAAPVRTVVSLVSM